MTYRVTAADGTTQYYTVTVTVSANSAKAFTAFSFTSALNSGAGVTSDVTGAISGGNISLTVPYGTALTSLKASFSTTGASVAVGSIVQSSGATADDFTNLVTYRVTAADGTTQNYTVTVTVVGSPAKAFTAFSFTSALNSGAGVSADSIGVIGPTAIGLAVPKGTTVTALKPSFTTTGASVSVGAGVQTSGATAQDFTNPVNYTVTAVDGTTKTYPVTVSNKNPIPDTGQTTSYTATFGEDNDYLINPPSYTDKGNGTILDNVTGLIWQQTDNNGTYTWSGAGTHGAVPGPIVLV